MKNEQKYKTAEERVKVFTEWCRRKSSCGKCEFHKFTHGCAGGGCEFYWLALEAEEEKPEPCPFCENKYLAITKDGNNLWSVSCTACLYESRHHADRDTAIAAHNRFARAARMAKESEAGQ